MVEVHRSEAGADAVVHIDLHNVSGRKVRIEDVRLVYLRGDRTVSSESPGESFFRRDALVHDARIEAGRQTEWIGVCLEEPSEDADRVRFELDLVRRWRLRLQRSTESVEIGLRNAPEPLVLRLPFDGTWAVSQAHGCRTNHRLGGHGGEYAYDFLALDDQTLRPANAEYERGRHNRDTAGFGRPVLSPVDGLVVRTVSDVPDNDGAESYPRRSVLEELRDPVWGLGNHVVLEAGESTFVLLGHLREGSITVEPGARVRAGEVLGSCGNSGNSIMPHLHVQVMDRADPGDPEVRGLPAVFAGYLESVVVSEGDRRDALRRRRSVGHPVEGSIVQPLEPDAEEPPPSR